MAAGYKWEDKSATIYFYSEFSNSWNYSVSEAMATWNAVKDYRTGENIATLALTKDNSCVNKIYYQSLGTNILGQTTPAVYDDNTLAYVTIALNSNKSYSIIGEVAGQYDLQSVMVHELGHALGIAHCHEKEEEEMEGFDCFSATCTSNVMYWNLGTNTTRRNLTEYDVASKQVIYW